MKLLERVVSLYAPHLCAGCEVEGAILCNDCLHSLTAVVPCCYRCRSASAMGVTCRSCRPSDIMAVSVATQYNGAAKAVVWQLKFGRAAAAAQCMAKAMAIQSEPRLSRIIALAAQRSIPVIVVPAPTAAARARTRGYDQAALLAKAFARQVGVGYTPLLARLGSQRQVGANRAQRQVQLKGAFEVIAPRRLQGAHVILIDDVMTTGSTLEAAAVTLRAAGARSVEAAVFAKA